MGSGPEVFRSEVYVQKRVFRHKVCEKALCIMNGLPQFNARYSDKPSKLY